MHLARNKKKTAVIAFVRGSDVFVSLPTSEASHNSLPTSAPPLNTMTRDVDCNLYAMLRKTLTQHIREMLQV